MTSGISCCSSQWTASKPPGDSAWSFKDARERIRAYPEMARKVLPKRDLRITRVSARFWQHFIVYRYENSGVHILRVLHGSMDIKAQLRKLPR
jgi:plasmid stabilization system protein ParE